MVENEPIKHKDRSLYKIGDISPLGSKIADIYFYSSDYIIFKTEENTVSWEFANSPPWVNKTVNRCTSLIDATNSLLPRKYKENVDSMLASALHSSMVSTEEPDITNLFKSVEDFIEKYKNEIKERIADNTNYEIYIDQKDTIQFYYPNLPTHLNKVRAKFINLNSLLNSSLPEFRKTAASTMLASALAIALEKEDNDDPELIFKDIERFIVSHISADLKIRLFFANLLTAISCVLIFFVLDLCTSHKNVIFFLSAGSGVLGAIVSSIQRNNNIAIDHYGSIMSLYAESLSRLVIGIVFGLFIIFSAKSEIVLAPFKDNVYAIVCFAFIAGFSERFVPDLISKISKETEEKQAA